MFSTIFRSFFSAFFGVIGVIFGLLCAIFVIVWIAYLAPDANLPSASKILSDAKGHRKKLDKSAPVILQIDIDSVIGGKLLNADQIDKILSSVEKEEFGKERVKGILLNINSPGGEVFETDQIYRLLKEYKTRNHVPIYTFVNGLCASGGYYIACASDKIFSTPVSIIGSVGVISWPPRFNIHQVLEKWNVETKTLYAGKGKDALDPTRPWTDNEGANHQMMINFLYKKFVDIVLDSRKSLSFATLVNHFGASVLDPAQATSAGYIDVPSATRSDVLNELTREARIPEDQNYQVIGFETKKWWKNWLSEESLFSWLRPTPTKFQYLYVQ